MTPQVHYASVSCFSEESRCVPGQPGLRVRPQRGRLLRQPDRDLPAGLGHCPGSQVKAAITAQGQSCSIPAGSAPGQRSAPPRAAPGTVTLVKTFGLLFLDANKRRLTHRHAALMVEL